MGNTRYNINTYIKKVGANYMILYGLVWSHCHGLILLRQRNTNAWHKKTNLIYQLQNYTVVADPKKTQVTMCIAKM